MYKSYCGHYVGDCDIQKSIRIDSVTYEIICSVSPGSSFSDSVRRMAYEYRQMKQNKSPGKK